VKVPCVRGTGAISPAIMSPFNISSKRAFRTAASTHMKIYSVSPEGDLDYHRFQEPTATATMPSSTTTRTTTTAKDQRIPLPTSSSSMDGVGWRPNQLKKSGIVPDILDSFSPQELVTVEVGGTVLANGEEVKQSTDEQPRVMWTPETKNTFYSLMMIDPDAPSNKNPINRNWCHWLVVNIVGCDIASGETIKGYQPPAPPKNTGLHRYVFLVNKQVSGKVPANKILNDPDTMKTSKFDVRNFLHAYNLGQPIGCSYFLKQHK